MRKPFAWIRFARISVRFMAWIFGFLRKYLDGFFARICCTDFVRILLHWFLCGFCCTDICTGFCTDFSHGFFGVSKTTCWEAPKFHRENPPVNSPRFGGPCGEGFGKQKGEVENLANLTKARASEDLGGLGGAPLEEVAILVDSNQDSKGKIKIMPSQGMLREGGLSKTMNRDLELCSKFFKTFQKSHRKSPLQPALRNNFR